MLKKDAVFEWGTTQQGAYTGLKSAFMTGGLVLKHPDPKLSYHLYTDSIS